MAQEIEELIHKLAPIRGSAWTDQRLQEYADGRFNPIIRKAIEQEVKGLANFYRLSDRIILHPIPRRSNVGGEFNLGQCHYGNLPLNATFGLRDNDFIKHAGIFGSTGSGKTVTALRIIRQLCEQKKPFLILDPKGTWQHIIRKPYARDVRVLKLGSKYAPYTFDPFKPLAGMDMDTLVSDVVETICDSQYLGFGAKDLLLRACRSARERGNLSIKGIYEQFQRLPVAGVKEKSWYASTLRALNSATTGILGKVLSRPENITFEKLMDSQVICLLDSLVDSDQVAMFSGLMLNRIYWFRKLAGIKEKFKHLLVIEEFHILSKADYARGESKIDFIIKMCREFSQGVMVIEQNPGGISQNVLGNLNTVISMNLGHQKDINAVGTAMVLDADARKHLGRLPTGWAVCRVKDRFPESVLVKVDHELLDKSELSEEKIKAHNKGFVSEMSFPEPVSITRKRPIDGRDKFTQLDRKILRYIKINAGVNLKNAFISLGVSYRRGNKIKNKLEGLGVIRSEKVCTDAGKEIQLFLTAEGDRYLQNTEDIRRLGGKWHQSAVNTVARHYRARDYRVRLEYRDVDVFADKGSEKVAVEVESLSGTKDLVNAVQNAIKALKLTNRLEIVVKNIEAAKKLGEALNQSPLKNMGRIKIYELTHYGS
jgi:hypothetical protein